MSRLVFVGSYLQVIWWALGQWKERIIRLNGLIFIELHTLLPDRYRTRDASQVRLTNKVCLHLCSVRIVSDL